ncbi:hypothetical protein Droror1_Dr00020968 [Drosera rotundifolia]
MKLHFLLLCLIACVASASSVLALCHDAERSALQHFKQGFSIHPSASIDPFAYPKTRYWKSSHNVSTHRGMPTIILHRGMRQTIDVGRQRHDAAADDGGLGKPLVANG